jgi:capsular exopolysaccharide synthesis family protein
MMNQPEPLLEGGGPSFSISAALAVLRKRLWLVLGITILAPVVTGLLLSRQPKIYEATVSLIIDASVPQYLGQSFKDVVELEASWWSAQESLQTELKVMSSHTQAVAVARVLCAKPFGEDKQPVLKRILPGADCADPQTFETAAPILQSLLRITPIKESRVVNVTVNYNDAELAALLANTIAQVYAERNLERRLSQSEGAATWLGDEYGDLTRQLNEAEHALIDFKKRNNVVAVGLEDQQNDLSTRRKRLSEELNAVQVKLIGMRAQRDQFAALQSDDPLNDVRPGIADTPVMIKLKELYIEQYAKLVELKGRYLEKHPTVVAQEARLDAIRNDLKREAALLGRTVDAQFQALLKQERDLKNSMDIATRESLQLELRAIEYNRLKRNFERLSKLVEQVGGRKSETSLAGHMKTNNVRILDLALVPSAPVAPNVPRGVGIAFALALVFAIGLAYVIEIVDSTVKTQEDIEKSTGLVFLGLIPRIESTKNEEPAAGLPPVAAEGLRRGSKDLYVLAHPRSPVAECCRAIRTNLLFMRPDKPAKSILVTSAGPEEGKTTTAVSLAITMAQSGLRVLLVDTDMRRPRLHKAFGIPNTADGISRAIVGEVSAVAAVRDTGIPNLFVLPCGALPPNPAELLHTERFARMVTELTAAYDRVIFDSPPVGAVTDAAILARITDGTILVAKSGRTSRGALTQVRKILKAEQINVLGCVLNDLDLNDQSQGYHYYYSRYGYYSSERRESAATDA